MGKGEAQIDAREIAALQRAEDAALPQAQRRFFDSRSEDQKGPDGPDGQGDQGLMIA